MIAANITFDEGNYLNLYKDSFQSAAPSSYIKHILSDDSVLSNMNVFLTNISELSTSFEAMNSELSDIETYIATTYDSQFPVGFTVHKIPALLENGNYTQIVYDSSLTGFLSAAYDSILQPSQTMSVDNSTILNSLHYGNEFFINDILPTNGIITYIDIQQLFIYLATQLQRIRLLRWTYNFKCTSFVGAMKLQNLTHILPEATLTQDTQQEETSYSTAMLVSPFSKRYLISQQKQDLDGSYRTRTQTSNNMMCIKNDGQLFSIESFSDDNLIYSDVIENIFECPTFDTTSKVGSNGMFTFFKNITVDTYDLVSQIQDIFDIFQIASGKIISKKKISQAIAYMFQLWQYNIKVFQCDYYVCHYNCHILDFNANTTEIEQNIYKFSIQCTLTDQLKKLLYYGLPISLWSTATPTDDNISRYYCIPPYKSYYEYNFTADNEDSSLAYKTLALDSNNQIQYFINGSAKSNCNSTDEYLVEINAGSILPKYTTSGVTPSVKKYLTLDSDKKIQYEKTNAITVYKVRQADFSTGKYPQHDAENNIILNENEEVVVVDGKIKLDKNTTYKVIFNAGDIKPNVNGTTLELDVNSTTGEVQITYSDGASALNKVKTYSAKFKKGNQRPNLESDGTIQLEEIGSTKKYKITYSTAAEYNLLVPTNHSIPTTYEFDGENYVKLTDIIGTAKKRINWKIQEENETYYVTGLANIPLCKDIIKEATFYENTILYSTSTTDLESESKIYSITLPKGTVMPKLVTNSINMLELNSTNQIQYPDSTKILNKDTLYYFAVKSGIHMPIAKNDSNIKITIPYIQYTGNLNCSLPIKINIVVSNIKTFTTNDTPASSKTFVYTKQVDIGNFNTENLELTFNIVDEYSAIAKTTNIDITTTMTIQCVGDIRIEYDFSMTEEQQLEYKIYNINDLKIELNQVFDSKTKTYSTQSICNFNSEVGYIFYDPTANSTQEYAASIISNMNWYIANSAADNLQYEQMVTIATLDGESYPTQYYPVILLSWNTPSNKKIQFFVRKDTSGTISNSEGVWTFTPHGTNLLDTYGLDIEYLSYNQQSSIENRAKIVIRPKSTSMFSGIDKTINYQINRFSQYNIKYCDIEWPGGVEPEFTSSERGTPIPDLYISDISPRIKIEESFLQFEYFGNDSAGTATCIVTPKIHSRENEIFAESYYIGETRITYKIKDTELGFYEYTQNTQIFNGVLVSAQKVHDGTGGDAYGAIATFTVVRNLVSDLVLQVTLTVTTPNDDGDDTEKLAVGNVRIYYETTEFTTGQTIASDIVNCSYFREKGSSRPNTYTFNPIISKAIVNASRSLTFYARCIIFEPKKGRERKIECTIDSWYTEEYAILYYIHIEAKYNSTLNETFNDPFNEQQYMTKPTDTKDIKFIDRSNYVRSITFPTYLKNVKIHKYPGSSETTYSLPITSYSFSYMDGEITRNSTITINSDGKITNYSAVDSILTALTENITANPNVDYCQLDIVNSSGTLLSTRFVTNLVNDTSAKKQGLTAIGSLPITIGGSAVTSYQYYGRSDTNLSTFYRTGSSKLFTKASNLSNMYYKLNRTYTITACF